MLDDLIVRIVGPSNEVVLYNNLPKLGDQPDDSFFKDGFLKDVTPNRRDALIPDPSFVSFTFAWRCLPGPYERISSTVYVRPYLVHFSVFEPVSVSEVVGIFMSGLGLTRSPYFRTIVYEYHIDLSL